MRSFLRRFPFYLPMAHFLYGLISCFSPHFSQKHGGDNGGMSSARYCYSVWLRHLTQLYANGMQHIPRSVAELGPGDSIGTGLCALLSGADCYYAFDVTRHTDIEASLAIFDELVALFTQKAQIPGPDEFPEMMPSLNDYSFPSHILSDNMLSNTLSVARVEIIRGCLRQEAPKAAENDICLRYIVPWTNYEGTFPKVDLIFSQAVLEHVDMLADTYRILADILNPCGFMSHQIDFRCHGTAAKWNGHYAYSERMWQLMRGKRPYLINRTGLGTHLEMAAKAGFEVLETTRVTAGGGMAHAKRDALFTDLSPEDLDTASAFLVLKKS